MERKGAAGWRGMWGRSLLPCLLHSLEQSCPCWVTCSSLPTPLCINTTTFFHDPISSLGREPRHPLLSPAWAPSLLLSQENQQWAGLPGFMLPFPQPH